MFEDLKEYAILNNVPIIRDGGFEFLSLEIQKHSSSSVLEIGTAIGYSAIRLASIGLNVTTIERNKDMYDLAVKNVDRYNLNDKIELVYQDALDYAPTKTYDLIFIDAAKAQNRKFFERFSPFLNDGGIIIVDNLNFHNLVDQDLSEIKSKNLRSLVRKINEFKEWLKNNPDYITEFTDMGDGMSVSIKRC